MIPVRPDPRGHAATENGEDRLPAAEESQAPGVEMSEQETGEQQRPATATFNVLFVCTGNTCRSPMCEGIARAEIERRGWSNVHVASAGLSANDGDEASREAVVVAERGGIDISGHRSRRLTPEIAGWADLILGMGPGHVATLDYLGVGEKSTTLGDFAAGPDGQGEAVQDPYGGSEAVYEDTFQELRGLIAAALDRLAPILAP
jgi:protein-tyrosine phosphatase